MTTLLPVFNYTQTLLLVAQHLIWKKPYTVGVLNQNWLLMPIIAGTCKELQTWLMYDRIWLPQLQALMYKPNLKLSVTYCSLLHRSMLVQCSRNPKQHNVSWKIAGMLMESKFSLMKKFEVYNTLNTQFGGLQLGQHMYQDASGKARSRIDYVTIWMAIDRDYRFGMSGIWNQMPQASVAATELFRYNVGPEGTLQFDLNTVLYLFDSLGTTKTTTITTSWAVQKKGKKAKWALWDTCCTTLDLTLPSYPDNTWGEHCFTMLKPYPTCSRADVLRDTTHPNFFVIDPPSIDVELDAGDALLCVMGVLGVEGNRCGVPFARLRIDIGIAQEEEDVSTDVPSELRFREASMTHFFQAIQQKWQ